MKKQNTPPRNWPAVKPNTPPPAGNDLPEQPFKPGDKVIFDGSMDTVVRYLPPEEHDAQLGYDIELENAGNVLSNYAEVDEICRRYNDFPALQEEIKTLKWEVNRHSQETDKLQEQNKELLEALKMANEQIGHCRNILMGDRTYYVPPYTEKYSRIREIDELISNNKTLITKYSK